MCAAKRATTSGVETIVEAESPKEMRKIALRGLGRVGDSQLRIISTVEKGRQLPWQNSVPSIVLYFSYAAPEAVKHLGIIFPKSRQVRK